MNDLVPTKAARTAVSISGNVVIPAVIAGAGEHAVRRFLEFFAATIRNRNTREALLATNPAHSVRGPKHIVQRRRTTSSKPISTNMC
jgi:hypothetical protein